jgi:hypothetical protein
VSEQEPVDISEHLSTLDDNALVARLVVVTERVLRDASAQELARAQQGIPSPSERADTEAVLDECVKRLQDPSLVAEAQVVANEAPGLKAENERLRGLIRATVMHEMGAAPATAWCPRCDGLCWWCSINLEPVDGAPDSHRPGCPWPALVAESEKPS